MFLTQAAFDFIEELDAKNGITALVHAFQSLIEKFGMRCFVVGDPTQPKVARDNRVWASTWPQAWLAHRISQNYMAVDPIVNQLLIRNEPIHWQQMRGTTNEVGARILDEAAQFGLVDGFTVPVYSRQGVVAGISIGTEKYELRLRDETCLYMASIYFHTKLEEFKLQCAPRNVTQKLTPREGECLSWVAAGKTDWEISQILSISEQTTHGYVQNAMIKLGATTRAQAVATAIFTKQMLV